MRFQHNAMAAARILERVWRPISARFDEQFEYDRHFDGGEWSGPAIGDMESSKFDETIHRIARRLGVTPAWLADAYWLYVNATQDFFRDVAEGCAEKVPRFVHRRPMQPTDPAAILCPNCRAAIGRSRRPKCMGGNCANNERKEVA